MKILYLSSVSFGWLKQRPQFICEHLSGKFDVCYSSFTPLGKKKLKGDNGKVKVKDLFVLPFALKSSFVRFLNKCYINLVLKPGKYDKIIVTHPLFVHYLPEKCSVIYECMDNMTEFYQGKEKTFVKECEKKLCEKSDEFVVSSDKLKEKLILAYNIPKEKITVINNALDKESAYNDAEIIELKSKNLVYVGTVSHWFDFETVSEFCVKHPDYYVYIVGANENVLQKEFPENMIFMGKVEHKKVFSYIKSADIVIMPFKVNSLIECVDPVKMYEYLALNKTIISSYWKELEKFESVNFYKTKEEFFSLATTLKPSETKISQQFVEENCWEERVKLYEQVLNHQ